MAMWAMVGVAALTALSTVISSEGQRAQTEAQAGAMEAQAAATRQQAELQRQKGELEASNIQRQKTKLRRDFEAQQGHNRSLLAASNVDMSSGSAADVSEGNILHFGQEMGENAYDVALKHWEANGQSDATKYQADVYDAQGSYLSSSAGSFGTSLLKGVLSGGQSFGTMYALSGFKMPTSGGGFYDPALQKTVSQPVRH